VLKLISVRNGTKVFLVIILSIPFCQILPIHSNETVNSFQVKNKSTVCHIYIKHTCALISVYIKTHLKDKLITTSLKAYQLPLV